MLSHPYRLEQDDESRTRTSGEDRSYEYGLSRLQVQLRGCGQSQVRLINPETMFQWR